MKTQQQHKAQTPEQTAFGVEKIVKQPQSNSDVITFDEGVSFDSHWSYSCIMDYILAHTKIKKRKS
jgi:hypothetical protein